MTQVNGYEWTDIHYSPHEEDVVVFWGGPFSNFVGGPFEITADQYWAKNIGFEYRTIEHFFQASKGINRAAHESVRLHSDPRGAKRMGRRVRLRPDWERLVPFDGKPMPGFTYAVPASEMFKGKGLTVRAHVPLKYNVMLAGLRVKFAHPDFRDILLATGKRYIAEDSPTDRVWGIRDPDTGELTGENLLGRALMQIRWEALNG